MNEKSGEIYFLRISTIGRSIHFEIFIAEELILIFSRAERNRRKRHYEKNHRARDLNSSREFFC